jgi:hypothetical protein
MKQKFYRKLMPMGGSYVVALPIDWVKDNKLENKDMVLIKVNDNDPKQLIISLRE